MSLLMNLSTLILTKIDVKNVAQVPFSWNQTINETEDAVEGTNELQYPSYFGFNTVWKIWLFLQTYLGTS